MALPAIDALAMASTEGTVDLFTGVHSAGVFADRSTVATLRTCPERFTISNALRFGARSLRGTEATSVVIFDRSRWLRIAATLSGARERHAIAGDPLEQRHESDVYLDLVRSMGITVKHTVPHIQPNAAAQARAAELLPGERDVAVVHPAGGMNPGTTMLEKRWPSERYAEVVRWLNSAGMHVLLTGSHADLQLCDEVSQMAAASNVTNLAGRLDLMATAAILQHCRVFVGSDTGISHIAAAVDAPVVAIFGPTNPGRYRPIGKRVVVVCPPESWEIADVDLRDQSRRLNAVSTQFVQIADVVAAIESHLSDHSGNWIPST